MQAYVAQFSADLDAEAVAQAHHELFLAQRLVKRYERLIAIEKPDGDLFK